MNEPEYTKCEITFHLLQALAWLLGAGALAIAAYRFSSPEWAAAAKAWGG